MDFETSKVEKWKPRIKLATRLALMLFIGVSLYLFVSAVIMLFLTKPDKEVMVPYVTGKRFLDVYNSLARKGLIPEIKSYDVYDMDSGIILSQYPEKGRIVNEGEKIKIVISRNIIYLPVPNLIGTKLPFAVNKLKNLHFNDRTYTIGIGVISYIPSDKSAESVIIAQSPEPGEEISPERKVNLLISAGKIESDMKMPELRGQSIDLCFDLLLSKGLSINEEIITTGSAANSGIIESQIPKPGETIQQGMPVKLKVNYYPQKERTYISYERVTYTIPSDEKKGLFEVFIDDAKSRRIAFSAKKKPGEKIDLVFKRTGNAKVSVTNNKQVVEVIGIETDDFN